MSPAHPRMFPASTSRPASNCDVVSHGRHRLSLRTMSRPPQPPCLQQIRTMESSSPTTHRTHPNKFPVAEPIAAIMLPDQPSRSPQKAAESEVVSEPKRRPPI